MKTKYYSKRTKIKKKKKKEEDAIMISWEKKSFFKSEK